MEGGGGAGVPAHIRLAACIKEIIHGPDDYAPGAVDTDTCSLHAGPVAADRRSTTSGAAEDAPCARS